MLSVRVGKIAEQWFFPISSNTGVFFKCFFGACVVIRISCGSRTHNLRADCLIHPDLYNSYFFVPLVSKKNPRNSLSGIWRFVFFGRLVGLYYFCWPPFVRKNVHPISPVAPRTEISTAEQLLRAELTEREREVGLKKLVSQWACAVSGNIVIYVYIRRLLLLYLYVFCLIYTLTYIYICL